MSKWVVDKTDVEIRVDERVKIIGYLRAMRHANLLTIDDLLDDVERGVHTDFCAGMTHDQIRASWPGAPGVEIVDEQVERLAGGTFEP